MDQENKNKIENEKKKYEPPTVEIVEFDFSEIITASGCSWCTDYLSQLLQTYDP